MNELFLKIINMSISASWLILAVLILRLVLKKAPKWVNVLLWGIVAVRLICPLSFESALSLIPSSETIPLDIEMAAKPTIDSGVPAINSVVNPVLSSFAPPQHVLTSANPLQIWIPILNIIWLIGVGALLLYTAVSYWRLCRKVDTAVRYKGNIFQSENVSSPFVLGIIKPRIYLPFNMNGQDLEHVVAHEQAHIRRKDHWWKPLGFLLLTIHWFNPLMWLAYVLLCRDIEFACDEKVIKELGNEQRADYTQALVVCSVNRRMIAACPLAFGEVGVKDRVKSVMNYKKAQIGELQSQIRSIQQEKISGDNIYRLLLAFDEVYHSATEAEQKEFMKAFIERIEMFPEKRKDGSWIKKIVFNFPVPVDGEEVKELPLETETTVETVLRMERRNR